MTTYTRTLIDDFEAAVDIGDDGEVDAWYLDSQRMADAITVVLSDPEIVDGIRYPEHTDVDSTRHEKYFEALCQFAAEVSRLPIASLRDAFHPDVYEPCIRYRP